MRLVNMAALNQALITFGSFRIALCLIGTVARFSPLGENANVLSNGVPWPMVSRSFLLSTSHRSTCLSHAMTRINMLGETDTAVGRWTTLLWLLLWTGLPSTVAQSSGTLGCSLIKEGTSFQNSRQILLSTGLNMRAELYSWRGNLCHLWMTVVKYAIKYLTSARNGIKACPCTPVCYFVSNLYSK